MCRSVDCFRLGWPMRADADFFCLPSEERPFDKSSEVGNVCFTLLFLLSLSSKEAILVLPKFKAKENLSFQGLHVSFMQA